jgi:hypothetical protein
MLNNRLISLIQLDSDRATFTEFLDKIKGLGYKEGSDFFTNRSGNASALFKADVATSEKVKTLRKKYNMTSFGFESVEADNTIKSDLYESGDKVTLLSGEQGVILEKRFGENGYKVQLSEGKIVYRNQHEFNLLSEEKEEVKSVLFETNTSKRKIYGQEKDFMSLDEAVEAGMSLAEENDFSDDEIKSMWDDLSDEEKEHLAKAAYKATAEFEGGIEALDPSEARLDMKVTADPNLYKTHKYLLNGKDLEGDEEAGSETDEGDEQDVISDIENLPIDKDELRQFVIDNLGILQDLAEEKFLHLEDPEDIDFLNDEDLQTAHDLILAYNQSQDLDKQVEGALDKEFEGEESEGDKEELEEEDLNESCHYNSKIDFCKKGPGFRATFDETTEEYSLLDNMDVEEWDEYLNTMMSYGITVEYDTVNDLFKVKGSEETEEESETYEIEEEDKQIFESLATSKGYKVVKVEGTNKEGVVNILVEKYGHQTKITYNDNVQQKPWSIKQNNFNFMQEALDAIYVPLKKNLKEDIDVKKAEILLERRKYANRTENLPDREKRLREERSKDVLKKFMDDDLFNRSLDR